MMYLNNDNVNRLLTLSGSLLSINEFLNFTVSAKDDIAKDLPDLLEDYKNATNSIEDLRNKIVNTIIEIRSRWEIPQDLSNTTEESTNDIKEEDHYTYDDSFGNTFQEVDIEDVDDKFFSLIYNTITNECSNCLCTENMLLKRIKLNGIECKPLYKIKCKLCGYETALYETPIEAVEAWEFKEALDPDGNVLVHPCPNCGNTSVRDDLADDGRHYIKCSNCNTSGPKMNTVIESIFRWNEWCEDLDRMKLKDSIGETIDNDGK